MLRARPKDFDPGQIITTRRWLHGIMVKLGRDPNAHPPDDRIVAQFLAISEWPRLTRVLDDLVAERKEPGHSYAWFLTVALQRIHGIQPAVLKQRRAELRLVRAAAPAPPAPQPDQSGGPAAQRRRHGRLSFAVAVAEPARRLRSCPATNRI